MKIKEGKYAQTLYELTNGKNNSDINAVVSNFIKVLAKNGQIKLAN